MRFEKIIVIGTGKIACSCIESLVSILSKERLCALEVYKQSLSMLNKICAMHSIEYLELIQRNDIHAWLKEYTRNCSVLIISANNRYIFPPEFINEKNIEIVNFHYSLLPAYRGMNIPTWVIFNNESQTGITWHYITQHIDQGKIISQKSIDINPTTTAFDITRMGMQLGADSFREFIGELLNHHINGIEINSTNNDRIYYKSDLPMNGFLDINASMDHIDRLLRSFDYGGLPLVPRLQTVVNDMLYCVNKYQIKSTTLFVQRQITVSDCIFSISEGNKTIILFCSHI
ncbi:MAG: hypothetical protein IJ079_02120 [Lachnospiraceae bacterium]|nr:hypothetical protein [Lachnospiraceae bacterium]